MTTSCSVFIPARPHRWSGIVTLPSDADGTDGGCPCASSPFPLHRFDNDDGGEVIL